MGHDALDCDIESILQRRENEECDILLRLAAFCQDIRTGIAASVENCLVQEKEYAKKYNEISELIAHLYGSNKDKITELDDVVLQQKVTEKKIIMATKQQAKLTDEINEAKSRKESIALQMVDLSQDIEVGRKERRDRWNAIKMACTYYKENLDFHIDLKQYDDQDVVKVTFFRRKNPARDSYYVNLKNCKNVWKVGNIEPALREKHLEGIKATIDLTKTLDILDIIAFLCKLKNVFSKHYFKE